MNKKERFSLMVVILLDFKKIEQAEKAVDDISPYIKNFEIGHDLIINGSQVAVSLFLNKHKETPNIFQRNKYGDVMDVSPLCLIKQTIGACTPEKAIKNGAQYLIIRASHLYYEQKCQILPVIDEIYKLLPSDQNSEAEEKSSLAPSLT